MRAPERAGTTSFKLVLRAKALKVTRKSGRDLSVSAYDTAGKKVTIKVTAARKKR